MLLIALAAAAAPVVIASKAGHVEFHYGWSAEAAAVPALDRRFRLEAGKLLREYRADVAADRAMRRKARSEIADIIYFFSREWETAGQSPRLLSLEAGTGTYTGGAHANSGTASLLWNRRANRELSMDDLLQRRGWWNGAIRQPACVLLDRERSERRQEPIVRGEWPNHCPELKELTLTLEDRDRDQRFDHVRVTADPYSAGPYAEGEYVVRLPLTAAMLARVKPEYRPSFEPQPPVQ